MQFKILWSEGAASDLDKIFSYIKNNSGSNIAFEIYKRLKLKVDNLQEFPKSGQIVPELKRIGINHIFQLISSPWKIYYKIVNDKIIILTVIDGRRNLEDVLYEKLSNKL